MSHDPLKTTCWWSCLSKRPIHLSDHPTGSSTGYKRTQHLERGSVIVIHWLNTLTQLDWDGVWLTATNDVKSRIATHSKRSLNGSLKTRGHLYRSLSSIPLHKGLASNLLSTFRNKLVLCMFGMFSTSGCMFVAKRQNTLELMHPSPKHRIKHVRSTWDSKDPKKLLR